MTKQSPFWKTYVAGGVLLALAGLAYFLSRKPPQAEKPKEKVFTLEDAKAKVKELTLAPAAGDDIRVVKEGEAWKLAEPWAVPADSTEVDSLLSTLESLEVGNVVVEEGENLDDYGLTAPRLIVGVLMNGASEPLKLLVGDKVPGEESLYAKLPQSSRVFTIPAYVETSLTKKPFDLRDRQVLHVKRDAVKTLEVSGPEGGYALAKDERGEWTFTKPLATRAGRWSVDGLLGAIENLRMEAVASENAKDLASYGLGKSARGVTLGLGDASTKKIEIGNPVPVPGKGNASPPPNPKYYARDASTSRVVVISKALMEDLSKGMANLRAKRVLEVATYEVEGIEVEADGAKRTLARSTTKDKGGIEVYHWKRTAPEAKDLETNTVQDVLFKVGGVEVQEFVDAPGPAEKYGLEKPAVKVSFKFTGGKPAQWFEVGQKEGAFYGRRPDDATILKLDGSKAAELVKAFKEL